MRKIVAGSLVVAGLAAGSLGVAALNPFGVATAAVGNSTSTTAPANPSAGAPKGPLAQTLDELVANGTITQAQADAVRNGVAAKTHGKGFGMGHGFAAMRGEFDDVAKQLGVTPQDLLGQLRSGKSIADVATAHGVDPQQVIDSLVASANTRIDDAVKNGKLDQTEADTMKQKLPDRIKALVEHQGFGKGQGFGGKGPGAPPPSTDQPSN